jgi:hypothetical protein
LWNRNDESRLMEENGRALYDKRFAWSWGGSEKHP